MTDRIDINLKQINLIKAGQYTLHIYVGET